MIPCPADRLFIVAEATEPAELGNAPGDQAGTDQEQANRERNRGVAVKDDARRDGESSRNERRLPEAVSGCKLRRGSGPWGGHRGVVRSRANRE